MPVQRSYVDHWLVDEDGVPKGVVKFDEWEGSGPVLVRRVGFSNPPVTLATPMLEQIAWAEQALQAWDSTPPPPPPETVDLSRQPNAMDYVLFSDLNGYLATAVPNAGIELPNSRHQISTHGKQAARLGFICSIADPAVRLRLQYSLDNVDWNNAAPVESADAGGLTVGPWVLLPQGIRNQDVFVRVGIQGNSVLSPLIRKVYLQVM